MSDQPEFNFDEPAWRQSDPATSKDAAIIALHRAAEHRMKALAALVIAGAEGATDFDLERATGVQQTSIGKRRHDLMTAGYVVPLADPVTGLKAKRPTVPPDPSHPIDGQGRVSLAQVWVITESGLEHAYERGITGARS